MGLATLQLRIGSSIGSQGCAILDVGTEDAHLGEEGVQAVDLLLLLHKGIVLHTALEQEVNACSN